MCVCETVHTMFIVENDWPAVFVLSESISVIIMVCDIYNKSGCVCVCVRWVVFMCAHDVALCVNSKKCGA